MTPGPERVTLLSAPLALGRARGGLSKDIDMGIYQRSKRPGSSWFVRFRDERGRDTVRNLGPIKGEAERLAKLELAQAARRRLGHDDERAEKLRTELRRPIAEHVEAHRLHLIAKGNTSSHVKAVTSMIEHAVAACGWETLADITPERFDAYRTDIREQRNLSAATLNRNTRAMRQLTRWLTLRGRLAADPLIGVSMLNEAADPRLTRGAFTDTELGALFQAARSERVIAPARFDSDGGKTDNARTFDIPRRDLVYKVAALTGLRLGEIRSLRASDFRLDAASPVVQLSARASKRGTVDVQPLPADLVAELRPFLATLHPQVSPWAALPESMARVVAADCAAAGFDAVTESGEVRDFHALRATYISRLARAGVPFPVVQRLARHSSANLTSQHYVKLGLIDTAGAVDSLAPIAEPGAEQATG